MGEKETAAGFAESDESNNTDDDASDAQRSNYLKMHLDRAAGGGGEGEPDVAAPDVARTPIIKSKSNITNN